jgi:hypothetical protein
MRPPTRRTLDVSMRHRPPAVTRGHRQRQLPTVPSHAVPTRECQSDPPSLPRAIRCSRPSVNPSRAGPLDVSLHVRDEGQASRTVPAGFRKSREPGDSVSHRGRCRPTRPHRLSRPAVSCPSRRATAMNANWHAACALADAATLLGDRDAAPPSTPCSSPTRGSLLPAPPPASGRPSTTSGASPGFSAATTRPRRACGARSPPTSAQGWRHAPRSR